jgi:hypothetical protein
MLKYLLDTFEPPARHIVALIFAVGSDQNDLALRRPYEVSRFGLIAQKSLKSKKLVV